MGRWNGRTGGTLPSGRRMDVWGGGYRLGRARGSGTVGLGGAGVVAPPGVLRSQAGTAMLWLPPKNPLSRSLVDDRVGYLVCYCKVAKSFSNIRFVAFSVAFTAA